MKNKKLKSKSKNTKTTEKKGVSTRGKISTKTKTKKRADLNENEEGEEEIKEIITARTTRSVKVTSNNKVIITTSKNRKSSDLNKKSSSDKKDVSLAKKGRGNKKEKKEAEKQKSNGGKLVTKDKPVNNKKSNVKKNPNSANNIKTNDESDVELLSEEEEEVQLKEVIEKGGAVVDEFARPDPAKFHVVAVMNGEFGNNNFFTATLNFTDVKENNNKFYKIQILREDNTNNYFFFIRWGRVGSPGQNQMQPFPNLETAKREFLRKYHDKTGKGYIPLTIDYSDGKAKNSGKKGKKKNDKKEVKSSLELPLQQLMQLIYNIDIMNQQMKKIGYNADKLPLGKLGQDTLKSGYEILKELEAVIDGKKKGDVYALTSAFYSKIPHNFGFKKMSNFLINNKALIKEKVDMLESLSDIEIATKILDEVKNNEKHDIFHSHYTKLCCDIRHIKNNEKIYSILDTYLTNSSSDNKYRKLQLVEAFEVTRNGESKKFKDLGNKMLLWHGSRITNYVGILSQGLRIAPPEAPASGYLFGKGVYFADMASKSACYCCPSNDIALILLCEVALGSPNEHFTTNHNAANLPNGKHSTKGCGRTIPSDHIDLNGVKVPWGKPTTSTLKTCLGYNEYIVYDTSQIKLKYLLKIKFS